MVNDLLCQPNEAISMVVADTAIAAEFVFQAAGLSAASSSGWHLPNAKDETATKQRLVRAEVPPKAEGRKTGRAVASGKAENTKRRIEFGFGPAGAKVRTQKILLRNLCDLLFETSVLPVNRFLRKRSEAFEHNLPNRFLALDQRVRFPQVFRIDRSQVCLERALDLARFDPLGDHIEQVTLLEHVRGLVT